MESKDGQGTRTTDTSEAPLILFCTIHKDSQGKPRTFTHMGERAIYDDQGRFLRDEPIYECLECVYGRFP